MPSFKEFMEDDLKVFLNEDEFAEKATIDDVEVTVVFDSDQLLQQKLKQGEGLNKDELLFRVTKDELPFYPRPGDQFKLNGEPYYIQEVKDEVGIFSIKIGVATS